MNELRWAMIGCGSIAHEFAQAMIAHGRKPYAVANRTYKTAKQFAEQYGIETVYEHIDDVFADKAVDVVYLATPHNTHITYLRKGLSAGKHILCEKAITLNSSELAEAVSLAEQQGVVLAEAMTLYHMPIYEKLNQKILSGALGKFRLIHAHFGSYKPYDMNNRFFNPEVAGGALLDIGVYALSAVRWFFSSAPQTVFSQMNYAPSGVDEQSCIILKNAEQELATVLVSLHVKQPKRITAAFELGYVEIYEYPRSTKAVITYTADGHQEILEAGASEDALYYEILDMEQAIAGGKNQMYLQYTQDVMQTMTQIRKEWGLTYQEEQA